MRGKILFSGLFTLELWLMLHAFGQAQARIPLPPETRCVVQVQAALPAEAAPSEAARPAPRILRTPAPAVPRLPAARLTLPAPHLPHYRVAWQAFHLEGASG